MPDTTRRWPRPNEMAEKIMANVEGQVGPDAYGPLRGALVSFYSRGGFDLERKMSRLNEKLKDAIEAGVFGDLFEDGEGEGVTPGDFDPSLGHVRTQAGEILQAMQSVYTLDVLNQVDLEGDLLAPEEE